MGFFDTGIEVKDIAPKRAKGTSAASERETLRGIAGMIPEFLRSNFPGMQDINKQMQSVLGDIVSGGAFQDPQTSPLYKGLRQESEREEERGASELRRFSQLGGMMRSQPAMKVEGDYRANMANQRQSLLGGLYETERTRDNPYTRMSAGLTGGTGLMQQLLYPYLMQSGLLQQMIGNEMWYNPTAITSPSMAGQVGSLMGGAGGAAGGMGTMATASDIRLKQNVKYYPIEILPGVRLASWQWNDKANVIGLFGWSMGVIAQDLEKVRPECVVVGDGYKRVLYGKLLNSIAA